jgi:hypothetical protein
LKLCGFGEPSWLAGKGLEDRTDDPARDLKDLARIAVSWAGPPARRKRAKVKSSPPALQAILDRLTAKAPQIRYPDVSALLTDLDEAQSAVPANDEAWDRLRNHVAEHSGQGPEIRQTA